MHVGFLTSESPYDLQGGGGIAAYLRAVIPALIAAGHRVTVLAHSRHAAGTSRPADGVRVVHFRLPNLHWYCGRLPILGRLIGLPLRQLEWSRKYSAVVADLMAEDPVDVLEGLELGALFLARRPHPPLIARLHGSDYTFRKFSGEPLPLASRWNHRLEQAVWRRARAITSPSRFQADEVSAQMGWPPGRVEVVPNPIAPEILAEALREPDEPAARRGDPLVLYVGRLAVVKGVAPLLEAVPLVRRQCPEARFVLAGPCQLREGPEHWGLTRRDDLGDEPVAWLGHVPWPKLLDWYRRAALLVVPSFYETFGISCLEAMAFGLPVVATRGGGLPEVVQDGVTGLLVPSGDAAALADAVAQLLADPARRRRMGRAGRERVVAEFTADRVARETVAVYERACG